MSLTATNAQVYKGTAAVTYGGGPGDPTTVLLMHCDGTNGGTSFTDSSSYNQTITNAGSVVTSTAAQKFGTASFYTNGTAGNYYLSVTSSVLMFGTGDFTIEFWMNPSDPASTTRNQRLMGNLPLGSYNSGAWAIGFNTGDSGKLHIDINNVINSWTATTAQVAGTWYHIALVRSGSTWYFFQNGVLQSTTTSTASFDNGGAARSVYIGWSGYSTTITNEYYNGYLDEIRFTYGKALYTANFTVSTIPFVASPSTALSLPGTTGAYMALGTTHPSNFDTSVTNFFVECWVYPRSIPTSSTVQYIVLRGTGVYGAEDIGLRILSTGYAEFYSFGAGTTIAIPNSGVALSVNKWYHLSGSIVSSTKTVYIFLDGVLKNSATMAGAPRTTAGSNFFIGTPTVQTDWVATNAYIQDVRVTRGGTIPTTNFTPAAAPFGLASPSYVSGGTTVLSLATQYYQTAVNTSTSLVALNNTTVTSLGQDFPGAVGRMVADYPKIINNMKTFGMTAQGPTDAWTARNNAPILYTRLSSSVDWVATMDVQVPNIQYNVAGFTAYADTDGSVIPMHACWLYWPGNIVMFEATGYGTTVGTGSGTNSSISLSNSTYGSSWVTVRLVKSGTAYTAYYHEDNTQTFSQMPGTYTWTSQPANIRIGLLLKSGASAVYTSYYRNLSVLYTGTSAPVYAPIGFTSRPILAPVLVSPGNQTFQSVSGTFSVSQTALQPLNGITWSASPLGLISLVSSTDYSINFSVASTPLFSNTFTVIATNKAGLSSVVQFSVSVTPVQPILTNMALWIDPSTYPGTGTTITDSSGNGRTFTFAGTPLPTYVASPVKSISFVRNSAFSTYNRLEINTIFLGDDMTIQAWIKTTDVGQDTWHYLLMTIMATEVGGPGNDWGFGVNNSGKLAFGAGTSDTTIASTSSVNTGTWINVAATRVKSSGLITLYVNGSSSGSGTGNAGNSLTSATKVWIGSGQDGGYSFGGLLGQVLAYTSVLSATDIAYNFSISRSTYGV